MSEIAIVLPPREAFSADAAGAIAMVARSHALHGTRSATVLGRAVARPFEGIAFRPVRQRLWPGPEALRYAAGVAAALRDMRPALIEVHNRPDVALFLARRFPAVTLFLHNDPGGMRAARSPELRERVAHVFAVSHWVAGRFGGGPGISVLPNGVSLKGADTPTTPVGLLRSPTPTRGREKGLHPPPCGEGWGGEAAFAPTSRLGQDAHTKKILFAGRVVADKGADLFVDACALALPMLPGWTATMIGADRFGPDSPETPFLRALRPRAAAAGVAMDGFRPHAEVLAAMAAAAIVVVPGRWPEPFGLVALEALASGATLIFTPRGALSDIVGEAGVPVRPDAADIAAAVVALARDPERRADLAHAGRRQAKKFEIGAVARRLDAERDRILATWSQAGAPPI